VPVIEQERGLLVGDASGQAGGSDTTGLPGLVAKHFEQSQADRLAGLAFGRRDFEVRGHGEMLITIGMNNPQRQDGAVMHGADEVLFDEGVDLVERLVQWERGGSSFFIRGHRMDDEGKAENLSIEKISKF